MSTIEERDPEIYALTLQLYGLTGQARTLMQELDKTVALLLKRVDIAEKPEEAKE